MFASFQTVSAAEGKRRVAVLVRVLGAVSRSISADLCLQCDVQIAWLIEPAFFIAHGDSLERNAASDGKQMQFTKEIDDVLLTCGYIADNSNKLDLDSLQLVERLLSGTV